MRFILCCLIISVAQAVDWSKVRPIQSVLSPAHVKNADGSRIVGGEVATRGQFPYQAAIMLDDNSLCGGTIISDTFVLTAAICATGTVNFQVHLGAQEIFDLTEVGRVIVTTSEAVLYPNSEDGFIDVDLALLRLPTMLTMSEYIAPIRMPPRSHLNEFYVGQIGRASGWGLTSDASNEISPSLKFVDMPIMANPDCAIFWAPGFLNDGKFCVDTSGGQSVCLHDNGGPLTLTESDGEVTQIGLMSSGSSAGCEIGYPTIFVRLASYLDWLESVAGISIRP